MSLDVDIALRLGPLDLEARLSVADQALAIVGPNGAGKTTLLRAIAGLVPLERGRVALGGRTLDDTAAGVRVSTDDRGLGVVFQDGFLFPHLDALDNVAFGLKARGAGRREARAEARDWLQRVALAEHATARVTELSGGQAQRVALARALAPDPAALLLDEPLSGLDAAAIGDIRRLLHEHLHAFAGPAIVVTHDPVEAALLADRLVVLEAGRITHDATIAEISRHPRTPWVARMAGLNLYRGTASSDGSISVGEATIVAAEAPAGDVLATIAPSAVALYGDRPHGSPRNAWELEVAGLDRHGDRVRVELSGVLDVVAEVTPGAAAELDLVSGRRVFAVVKATEIDAYPA